MPVEERDPHTGYLTTGHEWNGITELNRPIPKAIWAFIIVTHLFALVWWVLMPAWPLGETYTRGILGTDQRERVAENLAEAEAQRATWTSQIKDQSFEQIRADVKLMQFTRETGSTLFADNCASCHGARAQGGPGFPKLTDDAWLWGGDAETIFETIRVGINSNHPESRVSQMMAFGAPIGNTGILERDAIVDVTNYVRSLSHLDANEGEHADSAASGREIFTQNCAICHGDNAHGSKTVGAPDLTDGFWIYGGDWDAVFTTVTHGRQGQMPSWESRLTLAQRKILTLYVLDQGSSAN